MPRLPNAFKFRVADQAVLDTSSFLNLYSPIFLEQLREEDFSAPKLIVLRGSPGSGKSSLLRLFETSTLVALCRNQSSSGESEVLITRLHDLKVLENNQPIAFGIYIHCDSSLRVINNLDVENANDKMLNTLLDARIVGSYIRSLELLNENFPFSSRLDELQLPALPAELLPPKVFAAKHTLQSLRTACQQIETDFAALLNSFPGEPIPPSIQPHTRIFAVPYLSHLKREVAKLRKFLPILMLDDLHELYDVQRKQLKTEFLQRAAIPRWIAIRKHVYELEELISLDGAKGDRDFREVDLDSAPTSLFRKFVANVADRRLRMSNSLQQYNVNYFNQQLRDAEAVLPRTKIERGLGSIAKQVKKNHLNLPQLLTPAEADEISIKALIELESQILLAERKLNRPQKSLFQDFADDEPIDNKVRDAAELFAARRFKVPYYYSFTTLADTANGNVEQFLSIASLFADKMISRAELNRDMALSAQDQQKLIRQSAENYYNSIEQRFERGYAIKQLIDNLGQFCQAVTYRATAPIAPGVNGFGFDREQLRALLEIKKDDVEMAAFREVLTSAVAVNVLFVRTTKQGQAGSEKIVFYLNRLLCVKYDLPLGIGGWQPLKPELLIKMMKRAVAPKEWGKRWVEQPFELGGFDE